MNLADYLMNNDLLTDAELVKYDEFLSNNEYNYLIEYLSLYCYDFETITDDVNILKRRIINMFDRNFYHFTQLKSTLLTATELLNDTDLTTVVDSIDVKTINETIDTDNDTITITTSNATNNSDISNTNTMSVQPYDVNPSGFVDTDKNNTTSTNIITSENSDNINNQNDIDTVRDLTDTTITDATTSVRGLNNANRVQRTEEIRNIINYDFIQIIANYVNYSICFLNFD